MPDSKNIIAYLIPNCSLIWTDLSLKHWEWPFPPSQEFLGCSLWFTRASQLLSLLWVLRDTSQIMSPLTSKPSGGFPHDLEQKPKSLRWRLSWCGPYSYLTLIPNHHPPIHYVPPVPSRSSGTLLSQGLCTHPLLQCSSPDVHMMCWGLHSNVTPQWPLEL